MKRAGLLIAVLASPLAVAQPETPPEPEGLIDRIQARAKENLARLPDHVCLQTVERARKLADGSWQVLDTLRLEVGLEGNREMFAWRDARRFEEKELADMVGSGTIGNGNFALHAKNVFLTGAPDFTFRGEAALPDGRRGFRYGYGVTLDRSSFRIRVPPRAARVPFHGSFLVDAETLDLVRLEVIADDVPEELGIASSTDVMEYARQRLGEGEFLLPRASVLVMAGVPGDVSRNRTEFSSCRQFTGSSTVSFTESAADRAKASPNQLPPRVLLDLNLDVEIDLERTSLGDAVRATLTRPATNDERAFAAAGAVITGRIVRLDRETLPFAHYVVGIRLEAIDVGGSSVELQASMQDAGPASGLMRQEKRLDPVFTRQRAARMNILVREHQRGGGVLHWDAKKPRLPRGLRMKWVTE